MSICTIVTYGRVDTFLLYFESCIAKCPSTRDLAVHCPALIPLYPTLLPSDADELHVSNVTSSSLKLRWTGPDPKLFVYYEVVVTRLHDHALVLKTNVSDVELSVDNLESAQTYHLVVYAHNAEGETVSTRKGIITTSKFLILFLSQDDSLIKRVISDAP